MHPEVQRQIAHIRTDLDRFSLLEISSLVRHGYCVGRKACRARPDLFGADLPRNAPWDPIPTRSGAARAVPVTMLVDGHSRAPAATTVEARTLQASAVRRIWSSLFDPRDWTSYVYLPLLAVFFILLPTWVFRYVRNAQQNERLIEWLYQGNPDLAEVKKILQLPPTVWPKGSGATPQERASFEFTTNIGFKVVKETRIADLRLWNPTDFSTTMVQWFREVSAFKDSDENSVFTQELFPTNSNAQVRFPSQDLQATLFKTPDTPGLEPGLRTCNWGVTYDFSHEPKGQIEKLTSITQSPGTSIGRDWTGGHLRFIIRTDTSIFSMWILMPEAKAYSSWLLTRTTQTVPGKPGEVEAVRPVEEFGASDPTIIGFQLVSLKAGDTYEVSWTY